MVYEIKFTDNETAREARKLVKTKFPEIKPKISGSRLIYGTAYGKNKSKDVLKKFGMRGLGNQ